MYKILFFIFFCWIVTTGFSQYTPAKKDSVAKQMLVFTTKPVIAANGITKNWGFFCKKEWMLEKATKIPFKFRLGSLEYCNFLEARKQ